WYDGRERVPRGEGMTEEQWLTGRDASLLLDSLARPARHRKLRLFACAVVRLLPALPSVAENRERSHALSVAERFADGQADLKELLRVSKVSDSPGTWAFTLPDAFKAARCCAREDHIKAAVKVGLLRCIFGNPFRPVATDPSWLTPEVQSLAEGVYNERLPNATLDPVRLGVLADALEEVGAARVLLDHLRSLGPHVRGCWPLDLLTRRE